MSKPLNMQCTLDHFFDRPYYTYNIVHLSAPLSSFLTLKRRFYQANPFRTFLTPKRYIFKNPIDYIFKRSYTDRMNN